MKKTLVVILMVLVWAPSARAVTLVGQDGVPLHGQAQRWAKTMHVSSWRGPVTVIRAHSQIGSVAVVPTDWWTCVPTCADVHGTLWLERGDDRGVLYHELASIFDARYLHSWDHRQLLRLLSADVGEHLRSWYVAGVTYFADQYADCAENDRVNEDPSVCAYVDRVGRAERAATGRG